MAIVKSAITVFLLIVSILIVKLKSELACYSCKHDGKYLCLNETLHLHMEVCPGIPQEYKNHSGIQEVCYKTFSKQRKKPRYLVTRGCGVMTDKFNPCSDLKKVSVIGPKALCSVCNTSMCNNADRKSKCNVILFIGIFIVSLFNFS